MCNHENNVPSRLSPQWLCGNSCTWAHDVRLMRAHCFHDCIYIILSIYLSIYLYIYKYILHEMLLYTMFLPRLVGFYIKSLGIYLGNLG